MMLDQGQTVHELLPDDAGQGPFPADKAQHDALLAWAVGAFAEADAARKDREARWRRAYKLRRSYNPRQKGRWQSNIFLPVIFTTIETVKARVTAQLPTFIVNPVSEDDVAPAEAMEKLLRWAADMSKLQMELVTAWAQALTYGTGIIKVYHDRRTEVRIRQVPKMREVSQTVLEPELDAGGRPLLDLDQQPLMASRTELVTEPVVDEQGQQVFEEQRSEIVVYEGPCAEAINIFNFWVAPEAGSIEDARYVIERRFRDDRYVTEQIRAGVWKMPASMPDPSALWTGQIDPALERPADVGLSTSDTPMRHKVEVWEIWTGTAFMTVLGRQAVVRVAPNGYQHQQKPYVRIVDYMNEHEVWGSGEVEQLEGIQDGVNALSNQRIDNVRLVQNRPWIVDPAYLHDRRQLVSRPGQVIAVRTSETGLAPRDMVTPVDVPDVTPSAYTEVATLLDFAERVSAVSAFQLGIGSDSMNNTATGVAIVSEQGSARFSYKVRLAEIIGMAPLARMYGSILQQFSPPEQAIRVMGERGQWTWQQITADELQGALDYDIEAESSTQTETVRKEQAMTLLQALTAIVDPATGMPLINPRTAVENVLKAWGIKNMDQWFTQAPMMGAPAPMMGAAGGVPMPTGMGGPAELALLQPEMAQPPPEMGPMGPVAA